MSRKTRKLMWSVPLIAAVAVIGALAAYVMLAPGGALAHSGDSVSTAHQPPGPGDEDRRYDPLHRGRRSDVPAGDVERAHHGR